MTTGSCYHDNCKYWLLKAISCSDERMVNKTWQVTVAHEGMSSNLGMWVAILLIDVLLTIVTSANR